MNGFFTEASIADRTILFTADAMQDHDILCNPVRPCAGEVPSVAISGRMGYNLYIR
jgi:hypothetical protein